MKSKALIVNDVHYQVYDVLIVFHVILVGSGTLYRIHIVYRIVQVQLQKEVCVPTPVVVVVVWCHGSGALVGDTGGKQSTNTTHTTDHTMLAWHSVKGVAARWLVPCLDVMMPSTVVHFSYYVCINMYCRCASESSCVMF